MNGSEGWLTVSTVRHKASGRSVWLGEELRAHTAAPLPVRVRHLAMQVLSCDGTLRDLTLTSPTPFRPSLDWELSKVRLSHPAFSHYSLPTSGIFVNAKPPTHSLHASAPSTNI